MAERIRDNCDSERDHICRVEATRTLRTIIAAMRRDAAEYLIKPFDAERVSEALEHIEARRHVRDQGGATAQIVTIMGAKGGPE